MCPVCRKPMVVFELEGVEIDHCPTCFGTWLDAGELESITELAGAHAGVLSRSLDLARKGRRTRRRCPRCPRRLRETTVGSDPEVTVDHCPLAHGLWFDQGELAQIIHSHAGEEGEAVARFFGDLYRSEIATT